MILDVFFSHGMREVVLYLKIIHGFGRWEKKTKRLNISFIFEMFFGIWYMLFCSIP